MMTLTNNQSQGAVFEDEVAAKLSELLPGHMTVLRNVSVCPSFWGRNHSMMADLVIPHLGVVAELKSSDPKSLKTKARITEGSQEAVSYLNAVYSRGMRGTFYAIVVDGSFTVHSRRFVNGLADQMYWEQHDLGWFRSLPERVLWDQELEKFWVSDRWYYRGIEPRKYCGTCRKFWSASGFSTTRGTVDGLKTQCKECLRKDEQTRRADPEYRAAMYARNRLRMAERMSDPDYRAEHNRKANENYHNRMLDPEFREKRRQRAKKYYRATKLVGPSSEQEEKCPISAGTAVPRC